MTRNIGQQAWNHENNRKTRRGADGIDFEQDADDILSTRKKIQSTTVERGENLFIKFKVKLVITPGLWIVHGAAPFGWILRYRHHVRFGHDAPDPLVAKLFNCAEVLSSTVTPLAAAEREVLC